MKEIRREHKRTVALNPWTRKETLLGQEETDHILSDTGGIESLTLGECPVSSCGCIAPPVGFCAECIAQNLDGTVCQACRGECQRCHKPICARHSIFEHPVNQGPARLCADCRDALNRTHRAKSVLHSLLSPFIDFGDKT